MKPLTEWTTAELREQIYGGHFGRGRMLDELLRRERERCASLLEAQAGEGGDTKAYWELSCAAAIREMT